MKAWLVVAVVAACGKDSAPSQGKEQSRDTVKSEWGPKVQVKLEKIVAAAKAAEVAELGTADDKLALDFDFNDASKRPNAIAVQIDDVQSAAGVRPKPPPPPSSDELWNAAAEGKPIPIPSMHQHPARFALQSDNRNHVFIGKQLLGIEESRVGPPYWYEQLVNAKYLLVVTPTDVQWPEVEGSTFKPGTVRLRGILVEIDTAKPLGGYETTATSSDEVLVERGDMANSGLDEMSRKTVDRRLEHDFLRESEKAFKKGIELRWVGAKTPLNWGHDF